MLLLNGYESIKTYFIGNETMKVLMFDLKMNANTKI